MHSHYTIIAKLILRVSNKVNDGRAVAVTASLLGLARLQILLMKADVAIE
jgi:hypothetical protein